MTERVPKFTKSKHGSDGCRFLKRRAAKQRRQAERKLLDDAPKHCLKGYAD